MKLWKKLKIDYKINRGNRKGQLIVLSYRICNCIYYHPNLLVRLIGLPIRKFKSIIFKYIMGIELPEQTNIGIGLVIWHGNGLIVNPKVIIGDYAVLRHTTTIGNKSKGSGCPKIGNNVEIGAHSIIIGDITIGNNVTIGAGSVVTKSISSNIVAYGNPLQQKNLKGH